LISCDIILSSSWIMDYLFIKLMLHAKQEEYRYFNLGMAPLSGLEDRALAPLWSRLGPSCFGMESTFTTCKACAIQKQIRSEWSPKYLACPVVSLFQGPGEYRCPDFARAERSHRKMKLLVTAIFLAIFFCAKCHGTAEESLRLAASAMFLFTVNHLIPPMSFFLSLEMAAGILVWSIWQKRSPTTTPLS